MSRESASSPSIPLSAKARRTGEQPISFLMSAALANPDLVSFAAGFVDPLTLPTEAAAEITRRLLASPSRARSALQYDTTRGLAPLRRALASHLAMLEEHAGGALHLHPDEIVVTTGSQQGLYLAAEALLDPGDIVLVESPSYFVFTSALQGFGARCVGVAMDEQGLNVDALAAALRRLDAEGLLPRVKAVYTIPYYQNPTGLTLSLERRRQLLDVVRGFSRSQRILVLEDAAYRELHHDRTPPPASIRSLDVGGEFVAYFGTFSKSFAPGLKTGYAVLPTELRQAVLDAKGNHDFGSGSFAQHFLLEALQDGFYGRHVERLREAYRQKCRTMLEALPRHMPRGGRWTEPAGGLYTWLTLPPDADCSRHSPLFDAACRVGVLYVPGNYCFADESVEPPVNQMRLCFATVAVDRLETGVRRLAEAIRATRSRGGSSLAIAGGAS